MRKFLLNGLALLVGAVLSIGLLEFLLRIHNPFQARIKGDRIVLLTNKQYHIKNNIIPVLDREVTVTRNSIGFRGPNPPPSLDSRLSLVAIGGSTTQCFFLSDDKTWTARLGAHLDRAFRGVWVNNAGLDGHSTFGHLVLLEDQIQKLHPKVALFLVGANDVAREPNVEFDAENVKGSVSFHSPTAFFKSMSPYSEVASLVANLYRSMNAYQMGLLHQKIDLKQQGYAEMSEAEQQRYVSEAAGPKYLDGYQQRLRRIVEVCKRSGMRPILITQPLLAGAGIDDVTGVDLARVRVNPRANGKASWDTQEIYNEVTRRIGRETEVQVVDVARKLPKSSRNFYDFIHFTNEGAQRVADILYAETCPTLAAAYPAYVTAPSCP